jgi:3-oxoacyl-[acyl-carrier protein] reductase
VIDPAYKRVTIVTGASRGLGREISLVFGKRGDRVLVNYLAKEQCAADVVNEIVSSGGEAISFKADVSVPNQVEKMAGEALVRWGRIDVLINNAGIAKDSLALRMTEQNWDSVINTNLSGAFFAMRAVADIMTKQEEGHIINIASIVAIQGREGQANYSAAKAGLIGLTKGTAKELGRFNIKVNAILPGYIPTNMGDKVSETMQQKILSENTLNRASDPREVAEFIHHLSLMSNVSGQVFNLDSRIV